MKKLITFLGKGPYEKIYYQYQEVKLYTSYAQEALIDVIGSELQLIVGLTKLARETSWKGLEKILIEKNISYRTIDIFDGHNSDEMWHNFNLLYEELDEGDEIYFDVTHSFRSIPFIVMSVLNYARFIKNIKIKDIYYGAYEARAEGIAPIFNLSIFNQIIDWTMGAERFINTGDSRQLASMISNTVEPILRQSKGQDQEARLTRDIYLTLEDFSEGLYTVRGNKISEYGLNLKNALQSLKEVNINDLKPFEKILDKIYEKVHYYSNDLVSDIHHTVKLCHDLNLIQQSYTFLQENIISYLSLKVGIELDNARKRINIPKVLAHHSSRRIALPEELQDLNCKLEPYINSDIADLYINIGYYRNDLNHSGYRMDAKKPKNFKSKLEMFIKEFERLILRKRMLLIFSHSLTPEQIKDAKENLGVDEFLYLPEDLQNKWSRVTPDLENVSAITKEIKEWINKTSNKDDYILIQGEFGATYNVVDYCKSIGLKPLYSTTQREASERMREDGRIELLHLFKHIRFREY